MKLKIKLLTLCCGLLAGCHKGHYLDAKPDQAILVLNTLDDLQAVLDNTWFMNGKNGQSYTGLSPYLGELASDDYYIGVPSLYTYTTDWIRKCYTWSSDDPYEGNTLTDWNEPYRAILYANLVLENLEMMDEAEKSSEQGLRLKGSALFYRAHMYYQLVQIFAKHYVAGTAATDPGIVLRQKADVNEEIRRSTVQETYQQIIQDLETSAAYLPILPLYKTRPSRPAAFALLARTHLTMGNYERASVYADSCLSHVSTLIDYNDLDSTATYPFSQFNEEVLFSCTLSGGNTLLPIVNTMLAVDSFLFSTYNQHDLRRIIYYKPYAQAGSKGMQYRGSYDGSPLHFSGLAVDEVYLIRAECRARLGQAVGALEDLNTLLLKRFRTGTFVRLESMDTDQLLDKVLAERRKELVFRGLRWVDLRRLNDNPRFAKTLVREVDGQRYELPPNDPRYVFPIPSDVISLNPGMPQNDR